MTNQWLYFGPKRSRSKAARRIVRHLWSKDPRCYLCLSSLTTSEVTVDHYIPLSKGGRNSPTNLRVCCASCNSNKGSRLPEGMSWDDVLKPEPPTKAQRKSISEARRKYKADPITAKRKEKDRVRSRHLELMEKMVSA